MNYLKLAEQVIKYQKPIISTSGYQVIKNPSRAEFHSFLANRKKAKWEERDSIRWLIDHEYNTYFAYISK